MRTANNVIGLRNLDDAIRIKEIAPKVKNIIILGAGLVGVDAMAGLLDYDAKVTELNNKYDNLEENLGANKNQLDELNNAYQGKVGELEDKNQENAAAIAALKTEYEAKVIGVATCGNEDNLCATLCDLGNNKIQIESDNTEFENGYKLGKEIREFENGIQAALEE